MSKASPRRDNGRRSVGCQWLQRYVVTRELYQDYIRISRNDNDKSNETLYIWLYSLMRWIWTPLKYVLVFHVTEGKIWLTNWYSSLCIRLIGHSICCRNMSFNSRPFNYDQPDDDDDDDDDDDVMMMMMKMMMMLMMMMLMMMLLMMMMMMMMILTITFIVRDHLGNLDCVDDVAGEWCFLTTSTGILNSLMIIWYLYMRLAILCRQAGRQRDRQLPGSDCQRKRPAKSLRNCRTSWATGQQQFVGRFT